MLRAAPESNRSIPGAVAEPENGKEFGGSFRKSILVVDDTPPILKAVARALKEDDFSVRTANDGAEALASYKRESADLIITDRQMPNMGGLELLCEVKKYDPGARVIVLSGGMSEREREEFLRAGALCIMDKPVDFDVLKRNVSDAIRQKKPGFEAVDPKNEERMGERSRKPARVLIVDDDPDNRDALGMVLQMAGHTYETAENGLDALGTYSGGGFDLVISDLHMPIMDGREMLVSMISGNPKAKVIMISGGADDGERKALKDAGAFAVLWKPIDLDKLNQAISEALGE
ncbi:MAG: response regulator [Candidatus Micrarchaeia archaeon]